MEWGPGRHHIISPELGFDIYSFQLFMENVPAHTENGAPQTSGDAVRYYIGGEGVEVIGDETVRVRAGDFTCIPAGARHETTNPHDEDLRFICWQQIPGHLRAGAHARPARGVARSPLPAPVPSPYKEAFA